MWQALINPVANLLDKFIEDKDEKNKLAHELVTMSEKFSHDINLAQIRVNQQEAAHKNLFVAGWRPAVGWICGTGLAIKVIVTPLLGGVGVDIPDIELTELMTVLLGMLGMGGLRTYEKTKGVAREK